MQKSYVCKVVKLWNFQNDGLVTNHLDINYVVGTMGMKQHEIVDVEIGGDTTKTLGVECEKV